MSRYVIHIEGSITQKALFAHLTNLPGVNDVTIEDVTS